MRSLVTGLGKPGQMGEALAEEFARDGDRVALVDRTMAHVDEVVARLRGRGIDAHGFACDLADRAAVERLAADVRRALGGLDTVVCAAGGFAMGGLDDAEAWDRMQTVNLATAYATTRAMLPLLRESHGAIAYFGSPAALPGGTGAGMPAYAAAKSGVLALMRAVAADEKKSGVRANAVAPTAIRTAANEASMGDDADYVEREDLARVVRWLCTDPTVTGQTIRF